MLLSTPPPALVQIVQPRRNQYPPIQQRLVHLQGIALLELMSSPELKPLFQENAVSGKPLPPLRHTRLDNILFSLSDQTVITQGTPEAQAQFKALLALLDVKSQNMLLTMRLVQEGKPESRLAISTFSNAKGWMIVGETSDLQMVSVIPHLNRDGKTVVVAAQINSEKWFVQTGKFGEELMIVFPNNQTLFVTATSKQ